MDYRTVRAGKVLEAILRGRGFDPDSYTMTVKERAQYADLLNEHLRKAWECEFWPQLMLTERRQYRPDWNATQNYVAGKEVYLASGDAYFRALQTNLNVTPGTDDAMWEVAANMMCFVEYSQPFGTGSEIDDTGVDFERCVYVDDPLTTPNAVPIRGCRPWQRSIVIPHEFAPTRPYIKFRPPAPSFSFTAWSGGELYATGDTCCLDENGTSYVALQPSTGKNPATEPEYWAPVGIPAVFQDYLKLAVTYELQADDDGKYKTLAKAMEELDRLRDRHIPAAGLGGRAMYRNVRGIAGILAICLAGICNVQADGARAPGDYYAPGTRTGTAPTYNAGNNTNPPYSRSMTVYGTVISNQVVVFLDNTGLRVGARNDTPVYEGLTNEAVRRAAADATNTAYATAIVEAERVARTNATAGLWAGIAAYSNYVAGIGYLTAEADTNALAQLAAVQATFPSLSVADARRTVQSNSNAWITVEDGTGLLYRANYELDGAIYIASASPDYNGPAVGTVFYFDRYDDGGSVYTNGSAEIISDNIDNIWSLESPAGVWAYIGVGNPSLPATVTHTPPMGGGVDSLGSATLNWHLSMGTKFYPLVIDDDVTAKIADHDHTSLAAGAHGGLPTAEQIGAVSTNAPAFQTYTGVTGSIALTNNLEAPITLAGTGAVTVSFSALRDTRPIYVIMSGFTSVTFPATTYFVGGGSWQTNRSNHFLVWSYGTNLFVNPVTTSE